MDINYCKRDGCVTDLLLHALKYGERMTKEPPYSFYEMEGRLMTLFGVICSAAGELYYYEKEARRTLLVLHEFDYHRDITKFKSLYEAVKDLLGAIPLFQNRDYLKYPQVTFDEILQVKEELQALEELPFCGSGMKAPDLDLIDLAYKMYDMIFLGLEGIVKLLQSLFDDHQMLMTNPDMRVRRWQQMMKDYQEKEWKNDKQHFLKRLDEYTRQQGDEKASLTTFLKRLDDEASNLMCDGIVATLNRHYLDQEDHVTFVFEHRDILTREQMVRHLQFIHCRKLLEQEIELCDLRQPALGAYADLFTSRAAQGMAELLSPIIARHVDFRHNYHYAAWAIVMREKGLVYTDRRNGSPMATFINKTFGEQIDKTSLNRYLNKEGDFDKIKGQYDVILAIVNQALGREPKKDYFRSEGLEFFERVAILRKAIQR